MLALSQGVALLLSRGTAIFMSLSLWIGSSSGGSLLPARQGGGIEREEGAGSSSRTGAWLCPGDSPVSMGVATKGTRGWKSCLHAVSALADNTLLFLDGEKKNSWGL